jgi:hypothetical protein
MILGESLLLVIAGLVIGIPAALGAARLIRSEFYGLNRLRKNSGFVSGHDFSRAAGD